MDMRWHSWTKVLCRSLPTLNHSTSIRQLASPYIVSSFQLPGLTKGFKSIESESDTWYCIPLLHAIFLSLNWVCALFTGTFEFSYAQNCPEPSHGSRDFRAGCHTEVRQLTRNPEQREALIFYNIRYIWRELDRIRAPLEGVTIQSVVSRKVGTIL